MPIRKESGASNVVAALLVNIISLLTFYLLVTVLLDSIHTMDLKNEMSSLCDAYLEKMMADGCLTGKEQENLTKELTSLGLSDIDFGNTTVSPVDYGEHVTLAVSCNLPSVIHQVSNLFSPSTERKSINNSYQRIATSYH